MLENLSFVLMGLAAVVAFLTYVGAHSTPIPLPSMSKAGCLVAAVLLTAGVAVGMYPPVAKYNSCVSQCAQQVGVEGGGEATGPYIGHGTMAYTHCKKGAREAEAKARKAAQEAGGAITIARESDEVTEARCQAEGRERCTGSCFEE